jgi:two-component system chemotaxis response regulator CheB
MGRKIRLLVVDDSVVVQKMLTKYLSREPDIEVVATAVDPYVAREKILTLHPDVLTLDVEMPRMDGLQFLEVLMKHAPMPVVIHSSLASTGSETYMRALALGAVDVVWKPRTAEQMAKRVTMLAQKIRMAAMARVQRLEDTSALAVRAAAPSKAVPVDKNIASRRLLLIGASTGGPPAVEKVLRELPASTPPTLIVQHMPKNFTAAFASRLNELCAITVKEAEHGEIAQQGHAYVAPGDRHMVARRSGLGIKLELTDGPKLHSCRPAVDILFDSVAEKGAQDTVAVVLTGMGSDGATGLLALKNAGAVTMAQNEASCVVYGMPKAAAEIGAADSVLALDEIAARLAAAFRSLGAPVGGRA